MDPTRSDAEEVLVAGPGSRHWVGDGFPVRNLFPSNDFGERLGPFLLLDHLGPHEFGPSPVPRGVGEHPHRGFETVTLVFEGRLAHRDSSGSSGTLAPGDVQWMTAGDGVVHEELHEASFAREGGRLHGVQLWVNLPAAHKRTAPRYQEIAAARIPTVERPGAAIRVVAGELDGARGPAETFTPLELFDARLEAGAELELALPAGHARAVAVLEGAARVNGSAPASASAIAVGRPGGSPLRIAAEEASHVLVLGGAPLGEPVVSHGPFVMNTHEEIVEAVRDYQAGRMGRLDG